LAESLHPAAKDAFQSNFAIFLKSHALAAEVHPDPQFHILTGIARYDRREQLEGVRSGSMGIWNSLHGILFHKLHCDFCSVETRVIGMESRFSIGSCDLSSAPIGEPAKNQSYLIARIEFESF
jgi:hypothetical protein